MQTTTKRDLCEKIARRTDNTHMVIKKTNQMFLDEIIMSLHKAIVSNCVILGFSKYDNALHERQETRELAR